MVEKRALQLSIAIASLVPVTAGLWGIAVDASGAASGDAAAASHHRYLSGLLLAIGLGYGSTVRRIETQARRFGLLTALVGIGGLARLAGLMLGDSPTAPVLAALGMELIAAPLLCLWQAQFASRQNPPGIAPLEPHLRHIAS